MLSILIGVITMGKTHRATTVARSPIKTRQEASAERSAKLAKAADARIAQLSFKCIERYVCHTAPSNFSVPLFIDGMDENLRWYLGHHGYTDSWTDSAGRIKGQTIGPPAEVAPEPYAFVATVPESNSDREGIGSGMMLWDDGEHQNLSGAPGIVPWDTTGRWTMTWTLRNRAGHVVRRLRYGLNVVECSVTGGYCEKVNHYEQAVSEDSSVAHAGSNYPRSAYKPPPAFVVK